MNRLLFSILLFSGLLAQEQDTLSVINIDSVQIEQNNSLIENQTPEIDSTKLDKEGVYNGSPNESDPLPDVRILRKETDKLEVDEPFFELKSSIDLLHQQVDSLKKVISTYEKGKGAMPTIDEELLNLIKVPQLRHRIELQNGTIVNGEIIEEDQLGIIIQTSIGQLAIEKNRIVDIMEDLPPSAKVELTSEPFIDAFPDREEITGSIKNIGTKRADFVRVIAHLWSPTTALIQKDSVFISGQNQK